MNKLHLILPMAGRGSRFFENGFVCPKPLIEINGKPFFYWAARSIEKYVDCADITFVVLQEHIRDFAIDEKIRTYWPEARIIALPEGTEGAAVTALKGCEGLPDGELGIFAAIGLVEYARRGSKLVKVVRVTTETLQGIPSIVYGLFGMLFFVTQLHWGYSMIAGAFTLAIMVLPVIMRTTEEALIAVPDSYREGSFGLGAGKLRTVFTIVLPSAMPGILSGVILATGRIVGETAALIYTASSVAKIPTSVFSSTRTLAVHMYLLSNEGLYIGQTYGTAVVLLVLVLVINCLSGFVAGKLAKK